MATLPNSNFIFPNGKIGNLVFYNLNGKTVVRSRPTHTHKNKLHPSPLQLIQREKLRTINAFLAPIKQVLDFGYQEFLTQSKRGMHWAYAEINTKGYDHTQEQKIDPAYLKISKGNLLGPENIQLERVGDRIRITWTDNSQKGKAQASDETFILCYCPEEGKYIWPQVKFRRSVGEAELSLSPNNSAYNWHIYLAFSQFNVRTKRYFLSDSVYLGRL